MDCYSIALAGATRGLDYQGRIYYIRTILSMSPCLVFTAEDRYIDLDISVPGSRSGTMAGIGQVSLNERKFPRCIPETPTERPPRLRYTAWW
jgi:hypothetical protein